MTPIYWALVFLLVHVVAPWGLSLLSIHHGWIAGRPGTLNLLALIVVVPGMAGTIWMIVLHFLASPGSFLQLGPTQKVLARGPYGFSRNPMYLFELTFWFGWALLYGSVAVLIGFCIMWILFGLVAVPREERDLEARFGDGYREYKARVPRWLGLPRHATPVG
jgi:protein-S-isoprenylcysteine O-methyltransferase Ste14